jgi:enterochelin esterase-like enzyme
VRVVAIVAAALVALVGLSGSRSAGRAVRFDVDGRHEVGLRGPRGAPLLVFLHGRGSDPDHVLGLGLSRASRRLNVVLVDGGDHSYYHDRRDFRWGSYVLRDVIPAAVARLHADPRRVAVGGISMGGFGALDLARLAPRRFCAVGGHSAALWFRGADTPAGAFDDAADFERHDVLHRPFRYRGPLWLDVGAGDPFRAADTAFARAHRATFHVWPGAHDGSYWRAHLPAYLRFYVQSCR